MDGYCSHVGITTCIDSSYQSSTLFILIGYYTLCEFRIDLLLKLFLFTYNTFLSLFFSPLYF